MFHLLNVIELGMLQSHKYRSKATKTLYFRIQLLSKFCFLIYRFLTWGQLNTKGPGYQGTGGRLTVLMVVCYLLVLCARGLWILFPLSMWNLQSVSILPTFLTFYHRHFLLQDHPSFLGWRAKNCEEGSQDSKDQRKASRKELNRFGTRDFN